MKKKEQGILTIEASIVLTFTILFILFLFGFARVYNAQSLVSHAILQSSDAVALESHLREAVHNGDKEAVAEMANRFMGTTSINEESYVSLRSADVPKLAREKFITAIGKNEAEADARLKKLGVKDGLAGVDFSGSKIDLGSDDVIVYATYTIESQFSMFGMGEISVTKAAKSKTFGDILFGIETIAEDPLMGTASGGGSYKYGTKVQITATPNYGYRFLRWSDGNTQETRTVTVTGPHTYVAIFEASSFGVNLESSPAVGGTTTGAGEYKYLSSASISAKPAAGYHFTKWSLYGHKDETTTTDTKQNTSVKVDQTYTCTAYFEKNSYKVNVETSGTSSGKAYIVYNGGNHESITALYQTGFKLTAPSIAGYEFLGWQEKGTSGYISTATTLSLNVPAKNVTYVACYKSAICTVNFYTYGGSLYDSRQVYTGNSLGGSMPADPKAIGQRFGGWQNGFSASTKVYSDTNVYSNWSTCNSHRPGDCGVVHKISIRSKLSSHSTPGLTTECMCIVCADCGVYLKHNGSRWYAASGRYWDVGDGTRIYIAPGVWCIAHKNPNGRCESYKNRNSKGTYYIH